MTAAQEAIRLHQLWLNDRSTGERLDFTGANMRMALLNDANLRGAHLKNACFYGAKMQEANFLYANFEMASFVFANMMGCDMAHARMEGAGMWYTTLQNTVLGIPDSRYSRLRCPHRHLIELTPEQEEAIKGKQNPDEKIEQTIARLALENDVVAASHPFP